MGQYFLLVDLDEEHCIDPILKKLPEIIMNRSFRDLVGLLARPQGYTLSKPIVPVLHNISSATSGSDASSDANSATAVSDSVSSHGSTDTAVRTKVAHTTKPPSTGMLQCLDKDILLKIFDISSHIDVINLSMTNSVLFRIGHEYIQMIYLETTCFWAGHRLIVVGDYATYDDMPEELFNSHETRRIERHIEKRGAKFDSNLPSVESELRKLFPERQTGSFTVEEINVLQTIRQRRRERAMELNMYNYLPERCRGPPLMDSESHINDGFYKPDFCITNSERIMERLETIPEYRKGSIQYKNLHILTQNRAHYETGTNEPWAPCNLTLGEYVRTDAFTDSPENIAQGPFFEDHTTSLAEVLISQICWTGDPAIAMSHYDGWVHRGNWAGHRFVITVMSRMPRLATGLEWKDVSKDVAEDLVDLLEGMYSTRNADWYRGARSEEDGGPWDTQTVVGVPDSMSVTCAGAIRNREESMPVIDQILMRAVREGLWRH